MDLNMNYLCKIMDVFNNIEFLVKEFKMQNKTALMLIYLSLKQFELKNQILLGFRFLGEFFNFNCKFTLVFIKIHKYFITFR